MSESAAATSAHASQPREELPRARFTDRLHGALSQGDLRRLAAEHRARPFGPHGDELARLLAVLRAAETDGKLALFAVEPMRRWIVVRMRSTPMCGRVEPVSEQVYDSLDDAEHAVFRLRLAAFVVREAAT